MLQCVEPPFSTQHSMQVLLVAGGMHDVRPHKAPCVGDAPLCVHLSALYVQI